MSQQEEGIEIEGNLEATQEYKTINPSLVWTGGRQLGPNLGKIIYWDLTREYETSHNVKASIIARKKY